MKSYGFALRSAAPDATASRCGSLALTLEHNHVIGHHHANAKPQRKAVAQSRNVRRSRP